MMHSAFGDERRLSTGVAPWYRVRRRCQALAAAAPSMPPARNRVYSPADVVYHPSVQAHTVYQLGPGLERRLTDLQAQIDRLTEALQVWQNREDRLQPAERRLLQLTDRCAEVLEQWTLAGARHAEALSAIQTSLDSLNALESRV